MWQFSSVFSFLDQGLQLDSFQQPILCMKMKAVSVLLYLCELELWAEMSLYPWRQWMAQLQVSLLNFFRNSISILNILEIFILFSNAAGIDFPNTSLDLAFSPSSTTQTVTVPILNDAVPEDMLEYFSLVLMSTDPAVSLNPKIANITIIDDNDSKYTARCPQ